MRDRPHGHVAPPLRRDNFSDSFIKNYVREFEVRPREG